ncbi:MAG: alpha/beta fold hydrolase [Syntrophales bacterium]
MSDCVLVHGGSMSTDGWNELTGRNDYPPGGRLGGRIWETIIPALETDNRRVFAPTLADEHISNLTGHIEQICMLIADRDLRDIVLVAHSYGGMVITGAADRMADRIKRLVYVDAALPDPGQSLFDIIASGGRDPLSFAGLEAAPPYVEKVRFDAAKVAPLPKTYILCTESQFSVVTQVAKRKIVAAGAGWTYLELPTSHVPMATMPERFVQLLLDALR